MSLPAIFTDEDKAREHLEAQRWPEGPACPHCGNAAQARIRKMAGKSHRPGVYQCNECRKPFSVTVGTVFERSKIPLHTWLHATHLLTASKKGMSAHQLHRILGVTYKTAWFMAHRIREAMGDVPGVAEPMGGEGKVVEADETYFGKTETQPTHTTSGRPFTKHGKTGPSGKRCVVSLVERGGSVRSFHVDKATKESVRAILVTNVRRSTRLHTDESRLYPDVGREFADHATVKHSAKEYVRGDVHTNTIEGYFSVFKRGMKGVYQHCSEKHLHRYLKEFDFRYNNRSELGIEDSERRDIALAKIAGKRLTYRRTNETANA
ncbi:IS1595 family transposase [Methylocystis sp. SC2]|uniref:IS1595 family transposase n=1 Tax=Methylocystis sp. (strain SC2) TaxID=187303 RepID=UPI00027AE8B4|nr:IS1595 family transposase [Methylocystis sp. SC2]CCJ08544.1 ISSpo8, transposase [Methylocystis sp. SC2]